MFKASGLCSNAAEDENQRWPNGDRGRMDQSDVNDINGEECHLIE